ncbi:MAG: hypothetical protein R2713_23470 [Ilumatobacteraceae bacterium]
MSTPLAPAPRPDSDDITAVRKPDGAEHWIDKFDGGRSSRRLRVQDQGHPHRRRQRPRSGPWKHDGDDAWKIDRITEATPDASEYEEIKWTLKADGTDRDGPGSTTATTPSRSTAAWTPTRRRRSSGWPQPRWRWSRSPNSNSTTRPSRPDRERRHRPRRGRLPADLGDGDLLDG